MFSQGHPNLKEIGSSQTKQCINAYRKSSKQKKEPHVINKTMNDKMNKTGKTIDYPIWMHLCNC